MLSAAADNVSWLRHQQKKIPCYYLININARYRDSNQNAKVDPRIPAVHRSHGG